MVAYVWGVVMMYVGGLGFNRRNVGMETCSDFEDVVSLWCGVMYVEGIHHVGPRNKV